MKEIKLTAKESDATRCMIRFWLDIGKTFNTFSHGKFTPVNQLNLYNKLKEINENH